jgi:hypothetical protein
LRLPEAYYIQLCEPIQKASICNDTFDKAVVSYVCQVDAESPHRGVSGGNTISYGVTKDKRLEVTYSGGSDVGCDAGTTRTTRVVFTCNPDVLGVSETRLVYAEGACSRTFEVSSLQGCRACDSNFDGTPNSDYSIITSECKDGQITHTFLRTSACAGPSSASTSIACTTELELPYYTVGIGILCCFVFVVVFLFQSRLLTFLK